MEGTQDAHNDQLLPASVLDGTAFMTAQPFPPNGHWHQAADVSYHFLPVQEPEGSTTPSETGTMDTPDPTPNVVRDDPEVPQGYILVPQRAYTGGRQAVDPRRVNFTCRGTVGVDLGLTRPDGFTDLDHANERDVYASMGQKVTYRIEWPGYKRFSTPKNVKVAAGYVTRAAIVGQVTEAMRAFVEDASSSITKDIGWKVGDDGIKLNDMLLLGIDIVSQGSVQPRIAIRAGV